MASNLLPPDPLRSPDDASTATDRSVKQSPIPALNSRALFAGGSELVIFHYGEPYRLRETRQGKLILTK